MKITKKTPLRPRGRNEEKRQSTKDAIRNVYANGPQKEVQIIPAKKDLNPDTEKKKLRVCAYCRVSIVEIIRKMGNWPAEENWNVPGIYFADEEAVVYDVATAYKPAPKGGWTAKKQKEAAESANS